MQFLLNIINYFIDSVDYYFTLPPEHNLNNFENMERCLLIIKKNIEMEFEEEIPIITTL